MKALAILASVLALAGCDILGPIVGAVGQPACEPATGQTYAILWADDGRTGAVTRASTPHASCVPPAPAAAKIQLELKVVCMVADGSSVRVAWDAETNGGAARRSSAKLPGCAK